MKSDTREVPQCDFLHVHADIVEDVKEQMLDDDVLQDLSDLYKVFSDRTRIRILYVLLKREMCVCDIAQLLEMTQSAISHQLRTLKQSHLVKYRRDGKTVFYSLADQHVEMILNMGVDHVTENDRKK